MKQIKTTAVDYVAVAVTAVFIGAVIVINALV